MFKNDNLRKACLEAVDILVNENQKQRTVGKKEANNLPIQVDPCSNTTVNLLYRFTGSKNQSVQLMIQSKPNCIPQTTIIGAVGGLLAVVLFITIGVTIWIRRRKKPDAPQADTDINPVYGTYSRGSMDDGDYGDGDRVEVEDVNDNYG